jgi:hypothetical protein
VTYVPGVERVVLDVQFGELGATVAIPFNAESLASLLELLCVSVPEVSVDSWPAFLSGVEARFQPVDVLVDGVAVRRTPGTQTLQPRRLVASESSLSLVDLDDDPEEDDADVM